MTFIPGNPLAFDKPNEWSPCKPGYKCRFCGVTGVVVYRTHSSSDGAYDDDEIKCTACNKRWWVEGPDA